MADLSRAEDTVSLGVDTVPTQQALTYKNTASIERLQAVLLWWGQTDLSFD